MTSEHTLLVEIREELRGLRKDLTELMPTLDEDVVAATTALNDLVTALGTAGSGVSAADQTALETAITNAQTALAAQPAPTTSSPVAVPDGNPAPPAPA